VDDADATRIFVLMEASMSDEWAIRVKTNLAALSELFPRTFTEAPFEAHRPLALGIDKKIVEFGVLTEAEAKAVMRYYVNRVMYNRACVVGAPRYDLPANPVGVVTEAEAECSQARLRAILRKRDQQAEALRSAHRGVIDARQAERKAAEWEIAIAKAREQRLANESKLAAKRAAKVAAESEFATDKVPASKVGDGLSGLRAAATKRKAEAMFRAVAS
jgi:sRNA-binding protein